MELAIKDGSIKLISHPLTMTFWVCHVQKDGFVLGGWGKLPLIISQPVLARDIHLDNLVPKA